MKHLKKFGHSVERMHQSVWLSEAWPSFAGHSNL